MDIEKLWECLFLDPKQIQQLLEHVNERAAHRFIYPMFCFVAHTGCRRSEMMRSLIDDVDFKTNHIVIRERKKKHEERTTLRCGCRRSFARSCGSGYGYTRVASTRFARPT